MSWKGWSQHKYALFTGPLALLCDRKSAFNFRCPFNTVYPEFIHHGGVRRHFWRIPRLTISQRGRHHHSQRTVVLQMANGLAEQRWIGIERLRQHVTAQ